MLILEKIIDFSNVALKDGRKKTRSFLSTLIGEINMRAKNDGNRVATDEDSIAVMRKFKKNAEESHGLVKTEEAKIDLQFEIGYINAFLPEEVAPEQIISEMNTLLLAETQPVTMKLMGKYIKHFKDTYGNKVNPATLSSIVKLELERFNS
jgi:uncharacterized protein YqeY